MANSILSDTIGGGIVSVLLMYPLVLAAVGLLGGIIATNPQTKRAQPEHRTRRADAGDRPAAHRERTRPGGGGFSARRATPGWTGLAGFGCPTPVRIRCRRLPVT